MITQKIVIKIVIVSFKVKKKKKKKKTMNFSCLKYQVFFRIIVVPLTLLGEKRFDYCERVNFLWERYMINRVWFCLSSQIILAHKSKSLVFFFFFFFFSIDFLLVN